MVEYALKGVSSRSHGDTRPLGLGISSPACSSARVRGYHCSRAVYVTARDIKVTLDRGKSRLPYSPTFRRVFIIIFQQAQPFLRAQFPRSDPSTSRERSRAGIRGSRSASSYAARQMPARDTRRLRNIAGSVLFAPWIVLKVL